MVFCMGGEVDVLSVVKTVHEGVCIYCDSLCFT